MFLEMNTQGDAFSAFARESKRDCSPGLSSLRLEIKKLSVKGSDGREILRDVDLVVNRGEVCALLGPNASGKSTLAQVIAGSPKYKITQGSILFNGKDIGKLTPEKRVKIGIVLSWQNPPALKGVKLSDLLRNFPRRRGKFPRDFLKDILNREVNVDFSGGEKKMSELFQVLALKPKLVIFDEIDSGLDIKRLKETADVIKKELIAKKTSVLLITHSGEILNYLKPQITSIMIRGRIACQSKDYKKVLRTIKKYNYEKCKKCLPQARVGIPSNR